MKQKNLTEGRILPTLLLFAFPMMLGNLLQQVYNITDTLIVGRFVGSEALAAVGSTYSLMTFLTSLIIGLCMGNGAIFSMKFGAGDLEGMKRDIWISFWFVAVVTVAIYCVVFPGTDLILRLLRVPSQVLTVMRVYTRIIFVGIGFTFLFNYFAYLLRSMGNSRVPLMFLACSSILNIILDLVAVIVLSWGVAGAAAATVFSQGVAGIGIAIYSFRNVPVLRLSRECRRWSFSRFFAIMKNDIMTGLQQSVMNFGILMIQGLVNSFGPVVMAAFAASVKIDTFAYMPAQEFGNAYSLFISQNFGAGRTDRVKKGTRLAFLASAIFCAVVSVLIFFLAGPLMGLFVKQGETAIIAEGIRYLRIEGACYVGIGCLFLFYGYFRAVGRPAVSLILTIVSLGTRVALAYALAPNTPLGVIAIWWAIPIGWGLADLAGYLLFVIVS